MKTPDTLPSRQASKQVRAAETTRARLHLAGGARAARLQRGLLRTTFSYLPTHLPGTGQAVKSYLPTIGYLPYRATYSKKTETGVPSRNPLDLWATFILRPSRRAMLRTLPTLSRRAAASLGRQTVLQRGSSSAAHVASPQAIPKTWGLPAEGPTFNPDYATEFRL